MRGKIDPVVIGLRKIREAHKLSQFKLSTISKFGQNQISAYERGEVEPTLGNLTRWAASLGYELALRRKEDGNGLHDAHSTGAGLLKTGQ